MSRMGFEPVGSLTQYAETPCTVVKPTAPIGRTSATTPIGKRSTTGTATATVGTATAVGTTIALGAMAGTAARPGTTGAGIQARRQPGV